MAWARQLARNLISFPLPYHCTMTSRNGAALLCNKTCSGYRPAFGQSLAAPIAMSTAQLGNVIDQVVQPDDGSAEKKENTITSEVLGRVNACVAAGEVGRLFAVVHVMGSQRKVTDGDLLVVQGHWPPTTGERLLLDKVLLAGCADFTLVGRPILEPGLVTVEATVIEKSLSHTRTTFRKYKRKNHRRINFCRIPLTTLRINRVRLHGPVDGDA